MLKQNPNFLPRLDNSSMSIFLATVTPLFKDEFAGKAFAKLFDPIAMYCSDDGGV